MDLRPQPIPARSIHRIDNGRGQAVTCLRGPVWITQRDDPRDIILATGQTFVLDRKGTAIVFAFRDAAVLVGPAGHVRAADGPLPRVA